MGRGPLRTIECSDPHAIDLMRSPLMEKGRETGDRGRRREEEEEEEERDKEDGGSVDDDGGESRPVCPYDR